MINKENDLPQIPREEELTSKITLEGILGDKLPKDPLKRRYACVLFGFRIRQMQTGDTVRTEEEIEELDRICKQNKDIVQQMAEVRKLIIEATTNDMGKIIIKPSALVVHGEIKRSEAEGD